ncbi:MAG: type II toxin-antitoxin system VapC family toxin [Thermoproteota archaeon]|nr:type II toxin-antitoxin system VapC family toxin [Thermoproteota archaeon]
MKYLDTNIIIYAIENHPTYGKPCKKILKQIEQKKLKVATSMLTLVETLNVLHKINKELKKKSKKELNINKNINALLSLPIEWIDLSFYIIRRASEYDYPVNPVDYIHISSMELNSITEVISADQDLDKVNLIKRKNLLDFE